MKPIRQLTIPTLALFLATSGNLRSEDLTPKVRALLESKCKECHHPETNDDYPYLHETADLAALVEEEVLIAGNPDESPIFRRVSMDPSSKKRMPKSSGSEGDEAYRAPLTIEEQTLIREWITQYGKEGGAPVTTTMTTPPGSGRGTPEKVTVTEPDEAKKDPVPATKPPVVAKKDPVPAKEDPAPSDKTPAVTASVSDNENEMPANLELKDQVHWIFDKRCSQCHAGDYEPELHGTVNLMGFFREKDSSGEMPMAESIVERVLREHNAEGRMPKSKGRPGDKGFRPPLPEAERAVLKQWVDAGDANVETREFISQAEMIRTIHRDLEDASDTERGFFRYLTLTNLHNQADENGKPLIPDLDPHRAAVSKLVNSLSTSARITVPAAIDEAETIYRIDLRDYNWTKEQWDKVVSFYPYGIIGHDRQKEQLIERHTGSKMAYLRADWFTFAASQPPLYDQIMDKLLGIETTGKEDNVLAKLDKALGVDRLGNLKEGRAIRAGFQYSGVSGANRLIERHELGTHQGSYWVSYDFTPLSSKRRQELTLAPLGPPDAHLSSDEDHVFEHDGGEMIYSLPNGLQGYMLTTSKGHRLERAPIEIVQDKRRQDGVILNGISCMACHDHGVKPAINAPDLSKRTLETMEDEIRPLVEAAGTLDFSERKLMKKLYPEPSVLQAAIKEDFDRFTRAEAEATGGKGGSTEPILGLYEEFRSSVSARKLAVEFGLEYDELLSLLKEKSDETEVLGVISSAMERGLSLRRENLLREYISVVYALGYELMAFTPLGYEEFGGQKYAELVANSDQFLAAFGSAKLTSEEKKEAVTDSAKVAEALATESVLLHGGGKLRLSIQPNLKVGERAKLEIVATEDVHIRVYHLSSDEHVTELFPGSTGKGTSRPKNKKLEVSWETTAPGGAEHVVVFAAKSEIKNIAKGEKAGDFTVYDKDTLLSTRGVPKAIRAEEGTEETAVPAQITEARIGYTLKEK